MTRRRLYCAGVLFTGISIPRNSATGISHFIPCQPLNVGKAESANAEKISRQSISLSAAAGVPLKRQVW